MTGRGHARTARIARRLRLFVQMRRMYAFMEGADTGLLQYVVATEGQSYFRQAASARTPLVTAAEARAAARHELTLRRIRQDLNHREAAHRG